VIRRCVDIDPQTSHINSRHNTQSGTGAAQARYDQTA